jgi:uncharacterized DUF497 family protein
MDFEWDDAKSAENLKKHKVSFEAIYEVDWFGSIAKLDERVDYGEERYIAFCHFQGRLYVCIYVQRRATRRIISLRKANRRERKEYNEKAKTTYQ